MIALSNFFVYSPAAVVVQIDDNFSNFANSDTLNPLLQESDSIQDVIDNQSYNETDNKEGIFNNCVVYHHVEFATLFRRCYRESCCEVESQF